MAAQNAQFHANNSGPVKIGGVIVQDHSSKGGGDDDDSDGGWSDED